MNGKTRLAMHTQTVKVANIIEEGRLAGPQIRIAEVAKVLVRGQRTEDGRQRSEVRGQKPEDEYQRRRVKENGHGGGNVKIETTVIFPKYESGPFRERLDAYAIPYIQLPLHRLGRGWKSLLRYVIWFPIEILLLLQTLKKHGFDVVHVSGGSWQVKGVMAGKLAGCRVLWHLNDTRMSGVLRAFFRIVAKWGADGFITAGSRVQKYYVQDLGFGETKPVFVIQAPVDCSYFDTKHVEADERIGKVDGLKIVSVGNVNPLKGVEYFLYMAALLNQKHTDLHFFLVGPHWTSQRLYSRRLEEIRSEEDLYNMTFYGPSSDVRRIHKAIDIYVCASIAEASPISVWEAMAMEKAIVATDVGDIRRFITHGESGYIVPPGDSEALAHYVGRLVQDSELRQSFGTKASQVALEQLDISIVARKHVEAYQWISSERKMLGLEDCERRRKE